MTDTRKKLAIKPRCSKNAFKAMKRSWPVIAQKLLAVTMATAVSTPRPPAPNHTQRPKITRAEPASSTRMAAAAQSHAGCRPKCACSATAAGKSTSFCMPPIRKADVRAILATGRSQGEKRSAPIQRGVSVFAGISHCPAGAAECAPKALEIRSGNPAEPRAGVIMPMHRARSPAAARIHRPRRDTLSVLVRVGPIAIAAEIADWRPIRHRWWGRGVIERLEVSGAIHDTATDDGQVAGNVRDLTFGAPEEIPIGHHQIGTLTELDAAFLSLVI